MKEDLVEDLKWVDLLIIPTGGVENGEPKEAGKLRLARANQLITINKVAFAAIIGGKRKNGPSEAKVYLEYARKHFPRLQHAVVFIDAQSFCTNRDLDLAQLELDGYFHKTGILRNEIVLGVVSYFEHMKRAAIVLKWLGYKDVVYFDSAEKQCYSDFGEWMLLALTKRDPPWRGVVGRLLVWWASRRVNLNS